MLSVVLSRNLGLVAHPPVASYPFPDWSDQVERAFPSVVVLVPSFALNHMDTLLVTPPGPLGIE